MGYVQSTLPTEVILIEGDNITPSLLVWRRYKRPAPGVLEILLDINPGLIQGLSSVSPFLPVGALVYMPVDQDVLNNVPQQRPQINLWGNS